MEYGEGERMIPQPVLHPKKTRARHDSANNILIFWVIHFWCVCVCVCVCLWCPSNSIGVEGRPKAPATNVLHIICPLLKVVADGVLWGRMVLVSQTRQTDGLRLLVRRWGGGGDVDDVGVDGVDGGDGVGLLAGWLVGRLIGRWW